MSMSRNTCAESTLMMSSGRRSVSSSASAVLPEAVGPMSRIAGGRSKLAPTQEQPIEVGERQLGPGRAAVVALVGALGSFHLAQQGVHLRQRQLAVGAHRAV